MVTNCRYLYILICTFKGLYLCWQLCVMNHITSNCKLTVIYTIITCEKEEEMWLQNTISFVITQKDKIFGFLIHFLCKFFKYLPMYKNCNIQPVVLSIIFFSCLQQKSSNVRKRFWIISIKNLIRNIYTKTSSYFTILNNISFLL